MFLRILSYVGVCGIALAIGLYFGGQKERAGQEEAAALQAAGTTSVRLQYDASLFAGPAWNDLWEDGDEAWT
ncbi:MAG: hypothetical protein LBR44_06505, partial [Clostridiales Family XIII bacterium]|nr:hypothetical protein [Clostridiales Family XIII bacterium]